MHLMFASDTSNALLLRHIFFRTYSVKPDCCSEPLNMITFPAIIIAVV